MMRCDSARPLAYGPTAVFAFTGTHLIMYEQVFTILFLRGRGMGFEGRPTVSEIDLEALRFNFRQTQKLIGKRRILAIVKADAYGHGALGVSRELEKLGVDYLGVVICEEGIELRQGGIRKPIVVLGGLFPGQAEKAIRFSLTPTVFDLQCARELSKCALKRRKTIGIHVKIDTGMGRVGILPRAWGEFLAKLKALPRLEIEGILTHLAACDEVNREDLEFTRGQVDAFKGLVAEAHRAGWHPSFTHLANSASIMARDFSDFHVVRPGIMLYGVYPSPAVKEMVKDRVKLKPVMHLKSKVAFLKRVPRGFAISYGRTFTCTRESVIATVPIGYADGYPRSLSNRGEVLIGRSYLSAEEVAERAGTIPYELLCSITKRVPRIYLNG
jgi:alanine racemase